MGGFLDLPPVLAFPTEFITVYEHTAGSGYQSAYFGLVPSLQARYIVDIEWIGTGVTLGVGGIHLYCYTSGGTDYVQGRIQGGATQWTEAVSSNRQTITIDSDPNQNKAWVSFEAHSDKEVPVIGWTPNMYDPLTGRVFTPYTVEVTPASATVNVYNITQQVEDKGLVTAIGNPTYQGLGYDGPHAPASTRLSMEEIRNANMTATIFADVTYIGTQLVYLNDRVSDGWDLAIHFNIWDANVLDWETVVKPNSLSQYTSITGSFGGRKPTSWCYSGIGMMNLPWKNQWITDNITTPLPDIVPGRQTRYVMQWLYSWGGLYDSTVHLYKAAAEQGYALPPVYMHRTDGVGGGSDLSRTNWVDYFNDTVLPNGVKVTGYANVYFMHKNQEDATFDVSSDAGGYTITPTTNGYDATIIVKVNASRVTGVYQGSTPVEYSTTPENYVTFEVEDGLVYTVSTSTLIVIDSSMIDEELTDFPLMVRITDPDILSHDRKNINITTTGGAELYVEIESWDASEAILWVKVPTISNLVNTTLIMSLLDVENSDHVGDTTDSTTPNVWSNGYASVFHMADSNVYDSGPLRNDGIIHDTVNFVPALIGTGAEIKTTLEERDVNMIEIPDQPEYSPINNNNWTSTLPWGSFTTGRICVQMIWQPEEDWPGVPYGNWRVALGKQGSQIEYKFNVFGSYETYGCRRFYVFVPSGGFGSSGDLGDGNDDPPRTPSLPLEVGKPYLLHGQTFRDWDDGGGIVAAYEDGIPGFGVGDPPLYQGGDIDEDFGFNNYCYGQGVPGGTKIEIADTDMSIWVGNTPYYVGPPWSIIDEVRISTVNRNMAWMKAEYHNMNGDLVEVIPPPLLPPSSSAWAINTITDINKINGVASSFFGSINGVLIE